MSQPPTGDQPTDPGPWQDGVPREEPAAEEPGRAEEPALSGEVARLRAEVDALRAQLQVRRRRGQAVFALRRGTAAILAALAALSLVATVVGLWAAATVLNTDRWVSAVAPLPSDPQVSTAVAQYATQQVFDVVDVDQRVRQALPDRAAFVAGPITGQVRGSVTNVVTDVLRSDRFQPIWQEVNRRVHQRALAVLEGRSDVATVQGDQIRIDLLPVINQLLRELSARLPTLFGHTITLPDLSSGTIPDDLRQKVESALGVTLPANFAQFTINDNGRLRALQDALVTFKRSVTLLAAGSLVLVGLALLVAPQRRRTLLQFGVWLVMAAVTVTAILRAVRTQLLAQVPAGTYRDGVSAAVTDLTGLLRTRGDQVIWLGVLIAAVAYLVGPGRGPVWLRTRGSAMGRAAAGAIAAGSRTLVHRGPVWAARHRDPLRIAGVVVAVVLALVFSSWTALLVLAVVLAVYEVMVTVVTQVAGPPREGPSWPSGTAAAAANPPG